MDLLPGIQATSDALNAEKLRMDVIAQNIANAQNTRDTDGKAYQRKVVTFESVLQDHATRGVDQLALKTIKVNSVDDDSKPGPAVYNPGHPHADDKGMVQMPNVEVSREMVDLITASRSFEANLTVVRTARQMAQQAMAIGM